MSVAKLLQQWHEVWKGEESAGSGPRSRTLEADKLQLLTKAADKDAAALQEAEQRAQKAEQELQRGAQKHATEVAELQQKLAAVEGELQRKDQMVAASKAEPQPAPPAPDGHSGTNGAHGPPGAAAAEVPGEPAGNAAEQTLPQASETSDFYDAVLTVDKLEDLYDLEGGWHVTRRGDFDLAAPQEGVRVIPIGQFNSGKTWIIGKLCGAELPNGVQVHTEGISIKAAAADGLKIILLDTVGLNSPMYALPDKVDPSSASAGAEAVLQELRAQEDFYRQVCYVVGQVMLMVVGQMSHKDQTDLLRLARTIRKDRVRKDIIVVHNLREWSMAMLLNKSPKDGLDYMGRTKTLFGLHEAPIKVTVGTETEVVMRHEGLYKGEGDSRDFVVNVHHYYLTDDRRPCSRNKFAIADMKATITRSTTGGNKALAEEFAVAAAKLQSGFASFSGREPDIIFDDSTSRFRVKELLTAGAYKMKPRDLGGYFTLGSDDPSYNITLLPCTAVNFTGRGATRTKVEEGRDAYHLQIELPGLHPESSKRIAAQVRDHSALSKEPLEGETAKQWTVSFQAELLNVPQELYEAVEKDTEREVTVVSDPTKHKFADVGSRPNFCDGVRTVKVQLRTGIMDYDTSQEPVVTYLDGVLGIMLMKEGRRGH